MSSGLRTLLWIFFLLSFSRYVYPETTNVIPGDSIAKINHILSEASAGDTLLFHSGSYTGPFVLNGVNGEVNQPIVIYAESNVIIDGKAHPGMGKESNAFSLENCSWIVIEGFTIRNCWTDIITATNVSWFSLKSCNVSGGKRVVFAKDRGSHHFLVEDCEWEQDERVWTHEGDYSWDEIHHGIHKHFNGSIFQGSFISGVFVVRNNRIKNTFNAFRLSQINDDKLDPLACSNGEVYGNHVRNTSDNVFEPEVSCHNLHFYHNHMVNGHALISVTGVGGGPIYLYGNTGLSEPDCEDGWTIFKLSDESRSLSKPFYIFNNSWQVDYNFVGRYNLWRNSNAVHFNNAYFFENLDSLGLVETGENNYFDYDCSSIPFSDWFRDAGLEQNGIEANPMFIDALNGDFRLQNNSPCIDKGKISPDLILSYNGEAPDIGAREGDQLVEGPPFRYSDPGVMVPYKEHGRISRYKVINNELILWFSMPFDRIEVLKAGISLSDSKGIIPLKLSERGKDGYRFVFSLERTAEQFDSISLLLNNWPTGKNGKVMTNWASSIPVMIHH